MNGRYTSAIDIGLIQISNFDHIYLPYAAGFLQAYVQHHACSPSRYHFRLPIYKHIPLAQAVSHLAGVQVAGFSVYVWNIKRSLAIAQILKQQNPQTCIIFGGPHVPDNAQAFMQAHPFIDVCVHGEGEPVFLQLLETWPSQQWQGISGISYWDQNRHFVHHPKAPRIKDLNQIPSPYLTGVFEPLMKAFPQEKWCANWETNRGCPFSCTFCDWGSAIQSKVYTYEMARLQAEMEWFGQHKIEYMWCCDANFGILPRDIEIAHYFAQVRKRSGYPWTVIIQSAKNVTERVYQVQQILVQSGLNQSVTLSLQSLSPVTLSQIKRENISLSTYMELQHRYTHDGIPTYTDLILGLPGETYDSFTNGIDTVIQHGQHHQIKVFYAAILPNAEMGDTQYQHRHGLQICSKQITSASEVPDNLCEIQDIVVATSAMPPSDWVKARVFSWFTEFLHTGCKMLQIPFILLHECGNYSYKDLLEGFSSGALQSYPLLHSIQTFCYEMAWAIQQDREHILCQTSGFPPNGIAPDKYWPLKLFMDQKWVAFYQEAHWLLAQMCQQKNVSVPLLALSEALQLNHCLFLLTMTEPQTVVTEELLFARFGMKTNYNMWSFYQGVLRGTKSTLYRRLGHSYSAVSQV